MRYQYFRDTKEADSKNEEPVVFDTPSLANLYVDSILDFLNQCRFKALDYEEDVEDLLRPEFAYYGPNYMKDGDKFLTTVITVTMKENSDIQMITIICCGATALELKSIVFHVFYCGRSAIEKVCVTNDATNRSVVIKEQSRVDH